MMIKRIRITKSTLLGIFLYFILAISASYINYTETINNVIAISVLVLSMLLVFFCRKSNLLFIMSLFIAYSNYSVVMGIYLYPKLRPRYLYPQITDVKVYGIGIMCLFLFMLALISFLPKKISENNQIFSLGFIRKENSNKMLFLLLLFIFIFIVIFSYDRAEQGRGSVSAIYEYGNIFILLMFYYSGDNKYYKAIICMCAIVYSLTSFLNGTRIEALICMMIVYLCIVKKKIPAWILVAGLFAAMILMNLVGIFRGSYTSIWGGICTAFQSLIESKLVFDTCTHAYFPSLCMIEIFKEYSFHDGFYFLGRFILTIFAGQSRVIDGDLINYTYKFYYHNFGGWSIGLFYVWFSYMGPLIFGILIGIYSKWVNSTNIQDSDWKKTIVLYFVATVPRWYLYGPWSCTRGMLICMIIFKIFKISDKVLKKIAV